ncbi:lachesin isoform X2 [Petromyzon marinus]|nr:sialic acid-binding Ig-like lectin 15 isoform X2 [Petromyzon marinus]
MDTKIQVIWKKNILFEKNASYYIFNRATNTTRFDFNGRVSLVGDPENHSTASIQIRELKYSDSDNYYCRFEIEKGYETNWAIHLEVHSIPQVWNLTKLDVADPVNCSIFWCMVEGKPKPNITWDVPLEIARPLNAEVADEPGSGTNRYSSTLRICGELPTGAYTCRAINQHGEDSTSHDVEPPPTTSTAILIGASAATFFLCTLFAFITFWHCRIQRKSNGEMNQEVTKEQIYENTRADKSGAGQCESSSPNVDDGDVTYAAVIVGADPRREAPLSQDHGVAYASIVISHRSSSEPIQSLDKGVRFI